MSDEACLQERYAPHNACFGCGPANPDGLRLKSIVQGDEVVCTWQPSPIHEAFPGVLRIQCALFPYDSQHQTFLNVYEDGALAHQEIFNKDHAALDYYAGVEWTDSRTTFSIAPFSTATIFTGFDVRIPPNFDGTVYITATCSTGSGPTCIAPLAAIENVIEKQRLKEEVKTLKQQLSYVEQGNILTSSPQMLHIIED